MNKPVFIIAAWIALGLEIGLKPALELGSRGVAPSLVLPLLVFVALSAPSRVVRSSALLLGLSIDLTATVGGSVTLVGPYALAFLIVGELVMSLRNAVMARNPLTVGVLSFIGALIVAVVVVVIYTIRSWIFADPAWSAGGQLLVRAGSALYTGLGAIILALVLLPLTGVFGLGADNRRAAIGRRA